MFFCHCIDLFHTFSCQMFAQRIILKTTFQRQGNRLSHTGIRLSRRKTKIKVEINGSWNIDHSTVNH